MTAKNTLTTSTPYEIEHVIKLLGANLRIARLRRNLTIAEVAEKIGTGSRAVSNAESGKPSTSLAVYVALLWAYGLTESFASLASPELDEEGIRLERANGRERARTKYELDNDF